MTKIAILGWGSLLWDRTHREFDRHHSEWKLAGPVLKLEFSRKSGSRLNALTLVIDPLHGDPCKTAYAMSKRRTVEKALADLQTREGAGPRSIGCIFADGTRRQGRDADSVDEVLRWAQSASLDVVIWTDLPGHFAEIPRDDFVKVAVDHVQRLPAEAKALAAEYVWRAPEFIVTPHCALRCKRSRGSRSPAREANEARREASDLDELPRERDVHTRSPRTGRIRGRFARGHGH